LETSFKKFYNRPCFSDPEGFELLVAYIPEAPLLTAAKGRYTGFQNWFIDCLYKLVEGDRPVWPDCDVTW